MNFLTGDGRRRDDFTRKSFLCHYVFPPSCYILCNLSASVISEEARPLETSYDYVMGVAVLQLYTGKDNRTGPQTIELLPRRIVNLGAVQAGQVILHRSIIRSSCSH